MRTRKFLRNAFALIFTAAILLTVGAAFAQAPRTVAVEPAAVALPSSPASCPAPFSVTLDANTPYVLPSDVGSITNYQTSLNSTGADQAYLHTFVWKRERPCCQITSAVLTVRVKALQSGQSNSSPDAGNDNISIIHAGAPVAPYNERVYSTFPFSAGQTTTKTWNLTGAALNGLNTNGALTLYVQDDTSVLSATLQLTGCCLTN